MGKALIFVLLLIALTVLFKIVADWFQYNKNINIIPSTLIEMVAVIIFMFTFDSTSTSGLVWMWASVAMVIGITIFNLAQYGIKNGILVSLAELIFSVSAAFLIVCMIVASSSKKKSR